ncbi:glutamate--tRNA ligase [Desulfosudis oleivorans]|uniref:Glutamate--tRNA ligase n=1 Tax=Desulfosudis oleivorans (strain DSM 6200 / JCM 39069 / Hxd3) TaxID=96561 RepID=SYE_DESOH|nr:glutamate--tRNA ligase [Desulfosudis oleivorans]A8ZWA3.1 RecName: Full=Glutamate--tRNA ligase; AltName: Full=Glutamyl-tRNA synthetase; Short=GluRS [Desulfosudis oleivorans Hxd3]ABW68337.1 glutamyl-tRNA synthetase [Desulfosudis oleivorans Hxd3]
MKQIITRFPPSPTGHLHIGGARTALFNWLYARHTGGRFILRIEDTDVERSTTQSAEGIIKSLEWLGIDWDEGPYFQSRRMEVYAEYIQRLLASGHAYYCTCSPERLKERRERALAEGRNPTYDGTCREKALPPSDDAVVRFRTPDTGKTVLDDRVKGGIAFDNAEIGDFIIQRSDQTPTYNFAVVVDDITMGINTIIRGDDHVTNTPRQILMYRALDSELPLFAHVPMVLGRDRSRLSKRHGAMSVLEYRDTGYLPDGLINALVRLGWSHGDQEFFTRKELIELFSLEHIGTSAGVFDPDKLLAINAEHIKKSDPAALAPHLLPLLKEKGYAAENNDYLHNAIHTLLLRSKTLKEMADKAAFYYEDPLSYDPAATAKFLVPENMEILEMLAEKLATLDSLTEKDQEPAFTAVMEKTGKKFGKIAQPVRVALTGRTESPGIFETIEALGRRKTLERLADAVEMIKKST